MLFLIATPIGHLKDWSERAKEVTSGADLVLCEDTRTTQKLLNHYGINRPLASYHQFNEKKSLPELLAKLKAGLSIALLSDAGTPCINDPGQLLVNACHEENIPVSAIPGPCSPVLALTLSGFAFEKFQFIGFLPKKPKDALQQALYYRGATIALESPARLIATLKMMQNIAPERRLAVAREMTKIYEECRRGTAQKLLEHFQSHPPKGEVVLVLEEGSPPQDLTSPEELIELLQETYGISLKEALKMAAHLQKSPKRLLYKKIHFQPS